MKQNNESIKVSVFIPVYNGERFIGATLDCLINQTYQEIEVMCVDDSSKDGSYTILQRYADSDSRIKVFRKENGGDVPHSWQFIIPWLSGDFTMYMSQDDLLEPDTIEKLVCRQQETGADAVMPTVIWKEEGVHLKKAHKLVGVDGDTSVLLSGKEAFDLMMDYSISGFAIWRTQIIKDFPVKTISYNSDEFSQRDWASRCKTVAFSDAYFYYCQNNPDAITKQHFSEMHINNAMADGMLVERAHEIGVSPQRISFLANDIYLTLWVYASWFIENKRHYGYKRRKELKRVLYLAWKKIRNDVTLGGWKYRCGTISFPCFMSLVYYKKYLRE